MTEQQFTNEYPLLESDFRGAYDLAQSYPAGSIVRHEGSAWRAVYSAGAGEYPHTSSDTWSLLVEAGKKGDTGDSIDVSFDGDVLILTNSRTGTELVRRNLKGTPGTSYSAQFDEDELVLFEDGEETDRLNVRGVAGTSISAEFDGDTLILYSDGEETGRRDLRGSPGRGFTPSGEWNAETHYIPDSIVTYQGSTYRARSVNIGNAPSASSTVWELWAKAGAPGDLTQAAADARYAFSDAPAINLMPDSGRFAGKINSLSLLTEAAFTPSGFLGSQNGSVISQAGKFVHNNTDNGGTRGNINQVVKDLLVALGRTTNVQSRYGAEFYIAQYAAGSGTNAPVTFSDGVTRYLAQANGARALFGVGNFSTVILWIRCLSGSMVFRQAPLSGLGGVAAQRRNGEPVAQQGASGGIFLTPSDGWTHVYVLAQTFAGYESNYPFNYAAPGTVWQVALPVFFAGRQAPLIHTAPYPNINELTA